VYGEITNVAPEANTLLSAEINGVNNANISWKKTHV